MVQRTTVHLVDDLDGSKADTTISFAFNGSQYEIDLSDKNADKFERAIGIYVEAARKVGGRRGTPRRSQNQVKSADLAAIRAWARANGHKVSDRGRVSQAVRDAYSAAN